MRVGKEKYDRMIELMNKQSNTELDEEESKELWQLKKANMKDNIDYVHQSEVV